MGWLGVQHDHGRHELRQGGDGRHLVGRLGVDGLPIAGVEHEDVGRDEAQLGRVELVGRGRDGPATATPRTQQKQRARCESSGLYLNDVSARFISRFAP